MGQNLSHETALCRPQLTRRLELPTCREWFQTQTQSISAFTVFLSCHYQMPVRGSSSNRENYELCRSKLATRKNDMISVRCAGNL